MTIEDDLKRESGNLETVFFAGENAGVLDEWKTRAGEAQRRDLLKEIVKIHDKAFIDRLIALGVRPQTALALALVPLVLVAWADGEIDDRERAAILRGAEERGLTTGHLARRLLENALARKPDPKLFPLWKAYVTRLWGCFTADERWAMRRNLLNSVREVAEAAGGFLGLTSKISATEQGVLEELERILD